MGFFAYISFLLCADHHKPLTIHFSILLFSYFFLLRLFLFLLFFFFFPFFFFFFSSSFSNSSILLFFSSSSFSFSSFLSSSFHSSSSSFLAYSFFLHDDHSTPLGIIIGIVWSPSPDSAPTAVLLSMTSGTFLYIALQEVLQGAHLVLQSNKERLAGLVALAGGFGLMSVLAIWV